MNNLGEYRVETPYYLLGFDATTEHAGPLAGMSVKVDGDIVLPEKTKGSPAFIRSRDRVINAATIRWIDTHDLEAGMIIVHHDDEATEITGSMAVEAIMLLRPSALEGKRMKWVRRAWMRHNLIGHPLLMLLALVGRVDLGLKVHEATVPRPIAWLARR